MPGKLCNNARTPRTPLPLNSQAFCDGRKSNIGGQPITANPWDGSAANSQDKPLEEEWDEGWNHAQASPNDKGCCAE